MLCGEEHWQYTSPPSSQEMLTKANTAFTVASSVCKADRQDDLRL